MFNNWVTTEVHYLRATPLNNLTLLLSVLGAHEHRGSSVFYKGAYIRTHYLHAIHYEEVTMATLSQR